MLSASTPPENYTITECLGLVDELLVEDDPEYNWQDSQSAPSPVTHSAARSTEDHVSCDRLLAVLHVRRHAVRGVERGGLCGA